MTTRAVRANGRETTFALVTPTGYRYTRALVNDPDTWEEWRSEGETALEDHNRSRWRLGDWWRTGEKVFQEQAAQAIDAKRIRLKTLQNYAWVASRIPYSRRREHLSFSHHAAVAGLEDDDQERLLDKAEASDGLSVEELEDLVRATRENGRPGSGLLRDVEGLERRTRDLWQRAPAGRVREFLITAHEALQEASRLLAKQPARPRRTPQA